MFRTVFGHSSDEINNNFLFFLWKNVMFSNFSILNVYPILQEACGEWTYRELWTSGATI